MTSPNRALALTLILCGLAAPSLAYACSVCGCGDPLVSAGDSSPNRGQLRVALEGEYLTASARSDELPTNTEALTQTTLRPIFVYSPVDSLNVVLELPLVRKDWALVGTGESASTSGFGDADLGARWFFFRKTDLRSLSRQNLGLSLGTSLPTGGIDATAGGERLDDHAQLGTGALSPYLGALYAFHRDPWNLTASITARTHATNRYGYRYGDALTWSLAGQLRPWEPLALIVGLDGRLASRDLADGAAVENSGGLVLAAVGGVAARIVHGLWLHVTAQVPIATALYGVQSVGPVISASLQYSGG